MVKLASSRPEKEGEAVQAFLKVRTILVKSNQTLSHAPNTTSVDYTYKPLTNSAVQEELRK
jgi:hypothetical protein